MPTQTIGADTPEWAVGDTAPPLRVLLKDGAGEPLDGLDGATVVVNVAHSSYDYYYAPQNRIIDGSACVVDPDQVGNKGYITWTPSSDDLFLAGTFRFTFEVTFGDGSRQTIAPNATNTLIVRAPVGGMQYA